MSICRTFMIVGAIYGLVGGALIHWFAGAPIGAAAILMLASALLMAPLGYALDRICE